MSSRVGEELFELVWGGVGMVSCIILTAGVFGAAITAIGRGLLYLKTDHWITSACEAASFLTWDTSSWCDISTGWKGFDQLSNWATGTFELSFLLLIVGLVVFVMCLAVMIILAKLLFPQDDLSR
jgi:hypothetical protein